jgi:protein-disulfide isomerase
MYSLLWKSQRAPYCLATLGILAGIGLTIFSSLGICTSACTQTHDYRMWEMPFEVTGAFFFTALAFSHFYSLKCPQFWLLTECLIASALGAEIFFIILQKVQIGAWCPVCLSIAASVALTAIGYLWMYRERLPQGVSMKGWLHLGMLTTMMTLGFAFSFMGITKVNMLEALEGGIKDKVKFGPAHAPVQIYIFTDWACPACRQVEPMLEKFIPQLLSSTTVTFVDTVVHPETLNYAPYNLAFMAHDKARYFQIRENLTKLALKVPEPTDEDIQASIDSLGVKLKELPYQDVMAAMNYNEELIKQYKVTGTPTIVVVGSQNKKEKTLSGSNITEAELREAIQAVR